MSSPAESPSATSQAVSAPKSNSTSPPPSSGPPPAVSLHDTPPPSSHPPPPPSSAPAASPSSSPSKPPPPPPTPPSTSTKSSPPPPPSKSSSASPPPPPPPRSNSTESPPPPPQTAHSVTSFPHPPPPPKSPAGGLPSSISPPPPPSSSSDSSTISGSYLIAVGIAGVLAVSVLAVLIYCLCKKKKKYYTGEYYSRSPNYKDQYYGATMRQQQEWFSPSSNYGSDVFLKMRPPPPAPPSMPSPKHGYDPVPPAVENGGSAGLGNSKSWFTYQELAAATNGFARTNALGEGGFGCVYKGVLTDGQVVAIKQLKAGASQGEKEFRAEVEIISRVHHRHLVSLVGYCIADRQRLLVYDYVSNGTLEQHLNKRGLVMDWPTRVKIACGAARGLAYLHEDCHPRIIHRDIKSSNILLDDNFEAQVSDFGLAKLTTDTNTHVTTRVMGTFGYLAPEYASSGKLTEKSDVFSFGVVLLELITGRKPVDQMQPAGEESLVEWARPIMAQIGGEDELRQIVDPALEGAFDVQEMMRMVEAAAACVRHSATKRPRMGLVVRALEDESSLSDLNKGLKPGHSGVFGSSLASTEFENGSYSADMRKYLRVALGNDTREFGSEWSGATSEYGLNVSMSSSEYQMSREMDRTFSHQSRLPLPTSTRRDAQQHQ